jgi:flagellar motor switch protein FliM
MADETLPEDQTLLRERILDQEEVDEALGFRLPDREPEGDARAMLGAGAAPRERMPMLPIVFDDLCGRLSLSLRELFGTETAVAVEGGLVPRRYADVIDEIVLPAQLVTFVAEGWAGHGLLAAGPEFATLALDTLLGGAGTDGGQPLTRPFSGIETAILGRIADVALGEAEAAFREVLPVAFRRDRIESDPRLVAIARSGEVVLPATLRVSLDGRSGRITLVLPLATLEPARAVLRSPFMGAKAGPDDQWAIHLATEAWQSTLEVETILHETRLPLRQVLALSVGDTLMFEMRPSDLVEVRCGGLPVTRGHIGRVDGRIAVQVVEPVLRPRAPHEGMIV